MPSSQASNASCRAPSDEGYDSQNLRGNAANDAAPNQLLLATVQSLADQLQAMSRRQDEMINEIRRLTNTIHTLEDRIAHTPPSDHVPAPPSPFPVAPTGTLPPPAAPSLVHPPVAVPPPVPHPVASTSSLPERRPRRLAREDSFYHASPSTGPRVPRRLAREGAFYHISNSHPYPFKAPNGGIYTKSKPTDSSPLVNEPIASGSQPSRPASPPSPKRKRAEREDVKKEDPDTACVEEPSTKRRKNRRGGEDRDADDEGSAGRPPTRRLPARKASGRKHSSPA